ncbi:MAG: PDZ domain-containing protein [Acidobacteria bacterium]|nr:PDZ domain-containing protein [Acidobacteriota bacterium]
MNKGVPWRRWRKRSAVPPIEGRHYIHPAELPSFDQLAAHPAEPLVRHFTTYLWATAAAVLLAGSFLLASTERAATLTTPMPSHIVRSIEHVPHVGRDAARSILELSAPVNGRPAGGGAIVVGNGTVAVSTVPFAVHSHVSIASTRRNFQTGTVIGRDEHLGLTYISLDAPHPVTELGRLAATQPVLALAPYFRPSSSIMSIAYSHTVLSDPQSTAADGVVSYLSATTPSSLHGLAGSVAVDGDGKVVALFGHSNRWLSASYVASVALTWLAEPDCHGRLGIDAVTAPGGGIDVVRVLPGPSSGLLRRGDVITTINSHSVDSVDQLLSVLYTIPGRSPVVVRYARNSTTQYAVVHLGCQP